jgi:hypothetical protein
MMVDPKTHGNIVAALARDIVQETRLYLKENWHSDARIPAAVAARRRPTNQRSAQKVSNNPRKTLKKLDFADLVWAIASLGSVVGFPQPECAYTGSRLLDVQDRKTLIEGRPTVAHETMQGGKISGLLRWIAAATTYGECLGTSTSLCRSSADPFHADSKKICRHAAELLHVVSARAHLGYPRHTEPETPSAEPERAKRSRSPDSPSEESDYSSGSYPYPLPLPERQRSQSDSHAALYAEFQEWQAFHKKRDEEERASKRQRQQ